MHTYNKLQPSKDAQKIWNGIHVHATLPVHICNIIKCNIMQHFNALQQTRADINAIHRIQFLVSLIKKDENQLINLSI